jgi:hypothetical protein
MVVCASCIDAHAAGNILPDPKLTPGAVNNKTSAGLLCTIKNSNPDEETGTKVRRVSKQTKLAVYDAYGLTNHEGYCNQSRRGCELDHLISLQLGGSNDPANLWPQSYGGEWNAVDKDRVETRLAKEVCHGTITLTDAQNSIATNWIKVYIKYFGNK